MFQTAFILLEAGQVHISVTAVRPCPRIVLPGEGLEELLKQLLPWQLGLKEPFEHGFNLVRQAGFPAARELGSRCSLHHLVDDTMLRCALSFFWFQNVGTVAGQLAFLVQFLMAPDELPINGEVGHLAEAIIDFLCRLGAIGAVDPRIGALEGVSL